MRWLAALIVLGGVAHADTFGGFSGIDAHYLVNQDRVCLPIAVSAGAAAGMAKCEHATADQVAQLTIRAVPAQSGAKADFAATAAGRTLTITRTGQPIVTWDAPDPISKIDSVYGSPFGDRVAVAYVVRRGGRELTDVVAFALAATSTASPPSTDPTVAPPPPTTPAPPVDPKIAAAVKAARGKTGKAALAAWGKVSALDPAHSEALFELAAASASLGATADALAKLDALAKSSRDDAVEWRVQARFDPAFSKLRADPQFRAAAGLDRKGGSPYERFMGFGGQWEQTGTSCDKAEVRLVAQRDRSFKLHVKTACEGQIMDLPFHGTWRTDPSGIVLRLPTPGKPASDADDAPCTFEQQGDEDALHCTIGKDLDFTVLPTRR